MNLLRLVTPRRRYDPEVLEDDDIDPGVVLQSLRDIRRSNALFGGRMAVLAEIRGLFPQFLQAGEFTLLDIGTGLGDVPATVARAAARRGITVRTIGIDRVAMLAEQSRANVTYAICASGLQLPLHSRSVDIAMCSQVLHHFRGNEARSLLQEMNRVARIAVVISDLRRSWIAAAGFWIASFPLGFHRVTRHDGVVSVMRGFTADELVSTVYDAIGIQPTVHHRLGFRVTTRWRPI